MLPPPVPPDFYAVPQYILTNKFIGRAAELNLLDAWARSPDPYMVVEGIGGLGKSALTWEWAQRRAPQAIPSLAGRVWWSFYEKGTSVSAFVRYALAYVTKRDPDALSKELSHYDRCQELLAALQSRPYLLVLDGFERVLTAYHRWDKAQQRDDRIDSQLRSCVDPRDAEFLKLLLSCHPSKIIVSTRLFPSALEKGALDKSPRLPGVAHHKLGGLEVVDALAFYRYAQIRGTESDMLAFADLFQRHSLLLKMICGEIASYPDSPGDFDAWYADPNYGGGLNLPEVPPEQRYPRISQAILNRLDPDLHRLLCRIAVLSESVTYEAVSAINPFLPPPPEMVDIPLDPSDYGDWDELSEEDRATAMDDYHAHRAAYEQYQDATAEYLHSDGYKAGIARLDDTLTALRDRGLLQWDADTKKFDMHPVVRGHAAERLEDHDRQQTFYAAIDHFASLPPDDWETATDLSHVASSIEIYRCLVGAGLLSSAADYYGNGLGTVLAFHIGAHHDIIELLTPLFRGRDDGLPNLEMHFHQGTILTYMAIAVAETGREAEAVDLFARCYKLSIDHNDIRGVTSDVKNFAIASRELNRLALSSAADEIAIAVATAAEVPAQLSSALNNKAWNAELHGRLDLMREILDELDRREKEHPGTVEVHESEQLRAKAAFAEGKLDEELWRKAYDLSIEHHSVKSQHELLALRAEWCVLNDQLGPALDAIDAALMHVNRMGRPSPHYHDLRAWILARAHRSDDARAELASGESRRYAAEAFLALGDREQAARCAENAYRWAWGDGPPFVRAYDLAECRKILERQGHPVPDLPPFNPAKIPPIPYQEEIEAAIARHNLEKELGPDFPDASDADLSDDEPES